MESWKLGQSLDLLKGNSYNFMDRDFLKFFETAMRAQKQTIEEAWKVWKRKPAQELYKDGFKEYLLEHIDNEIKEKYKELGIEYPQK